MFILVGHFRGDQSGDGRLACATLAADPEGATGQAALAKRLDAGNHLVLSNHVGPLLRSVLLVELHGCLSFCLGLVFRFLTGVLVYYRASAIYVKGCT